MGARFFLPNKNKKISSINVIVSFKNENYKRSVGESIETIYWNDGVCRETREYPHGKAVNIKLKNVARACNAACDLFISRNIIPDRVDFWKEVDLALTGSTKSEVTFLNYFAEYIERIREKVAKNTLASYVTAYNKLKEFEDGRKRKIRFEDVNMNFYNEFETYMYSIGYSSNYFGAVIKQVKVVFKEARFEKLHTFDTVDYRDFKTRQETADTIYLNEDELLSIYNLEFNAETLCKVYPDIDKKPQNLRNKISCYEQVRAKFLIGCYTALRVSDFNRLEPINIGDDFIKIRTKKVGNKVVIPVHWMVRELLDRGFDLNSKISDQKINEHIKEICELAGINDEVEITKNVGGQNVSQILKKYELVTNHTARRSGATNMYKAGIPTLSIMKITGHTTEKSFLKYIKITAEENAEMLAKHSFFNKPLK